MSQTPGNPPQQPPPPPYPPQGQSPGGPPYPPQGYYPPPKKSHTGLIVLLILLGVGVVGLILMGIVVAIGPAIMDEAHKAATLSKLNMLELAIVRYNNEYGYFPPDSEIGADNKVDNEKFLEVMDEFGIKEESMIDGWGNVIVYDRVRDEDENLEINKDLPNDPRDEKILEADDEDEEEIYQKFFLWSQGPDPKSGIPRKDLLKEH